MKFILLFCFVHIARATITWQFEKFLKDNYGDGVANMIKRSNLGKGGSFGGGNNRNVKNKPVILVHGITNTAGTFQKNRQFFLDHGYSDNEVYGTTYGDGGKTNVIFAVAAYTSSKVDIISYSMGSPISRKAILGGACVDNGENLGGPLTGLVDTFVGVAGANAGSFLCVFPFGSCNLVNGMICGSRYLNDVNARTRYEGSNIFTVYSRNDDKVGYQACGKLASVIQGQNGGFERNGKNHDQVMFDTINLQYNLVKYEKEHP
ncbi:hypothetical protein FO519_006445 [Halicephalobus sp. NKZ332]|nr:hypothetical protein FO519_006445 [Halicephalobus sp. NKZ332]